jgi:hypothetical protein
MTATCTTLRKSTNPVLTLASDSWDTGDLWGSGMAALAAVCDVLDAADALHLVDPGAGFSPPPYSPTPTLDDLADADETSGTPWETSVLAEQLRDGLVSLDDLRRASRILSLYLDLVRSAGLDY